LLKTLVDGWIAHNRGQWILKVQPIMWTSFGGVIMLHVVVLLGMMGLKINVVDLV